MLAAVAAPAGATSRCSRRSTRARAGPHAPDRGPSRVRLRPETAATFAAKLESARAGNDRAETIVLRFGETLEDVARGARHERARAAALNGVKDAERAAGRVSILCRSAAARGQGSDARA